MQILTRPDKNLQFTYFRNTKALYIFPNTQNWTQELQVLGNYFTTELHHQSCVHLNVKFRNIQSKTKARCSDWNYSTSVAKAEPPVQDQPGPHSNTLSERKPAKQQKVNWKVPLFCSPKQPLFRSICISQAFGHSFGSAVTKYWKKGNLKRKSYFDSWFQRFQVLITCPHVLGQNIAIGRYSRRSSWQTRSRKRTKRSQTR